MKECKYCGTQYDDALDVCPNCAGNKVVSEQERIEEHELQQKEIQSRKKAISEPLRKRNLIIGFIAGFAVIIVVLIAGSLHNSQKPLSNGIQKEQADEILATGLAYFKSGNYEEALNCLCQLPPDSKQYGKAQDALLKSKDSYRDGILDKANSYIADGDYEVALELLKKAQTVLPDDKALVNAYTSAYGAYKQGVCDAAILEAKKYANDNDYQSALQVIHEAADKIGGDSELTALQNKYEKDYEANLIKEAETAANSGDYVKALDLLKKAGAQFPNSSTIQKKTSEYVIQHAGAALKAEGYEKAIKILKDGRGLVSDKNNIDKQLVDYTIQYADAAFKKDGYKPAIEIINSGLSILPGNSELKSAAADYESYKPVPLGDCKLISGEFDSLRIVDALDTLGNAYKEVYHYQACNEKSEFFVDNKYNILSGILAPSNEWDEWYRNLRDGSYLEIIIYGDDKVLASYKLSYKTEPFRFKVDITGVKYLKILSCNSYKNNSSFDIYGLLIDPEVSKK